MTTSERIVDYLIVGGGLAAATAAETIRKQDTTGSIVLIAREQHWPYHRPPLSKEYLRSEINADGIYGSGGVYVQEPDWYQQQHIEVIQGKSATNLDTRARTISLDDGQTFGFKTLLLATGGKPRALTIPGADLPNVYLLRTLDDSTTIREKLHEGQRIVVIGSGFIGLEGAASALTRKAAEVHIVNPQERIWPRIVSPEISRIFQQVFEEHGGHFHHSSKATEIQVNQAGQATGVTITPASGNGQPETLACDLVLVGVGINLNTDLATSGGLPVDEHHGILVDEHLETNVADIFAAGDVAAYPDPFTGTMHFEHWDNALASGEIAGRNMLGNDEPYRHIPYFFSDQFDLSLNMLGYPSSNAEIILRGDTAKRAFTAIYIQQETIRAVLMVNDDNLMDTWRDLIAAGTTAPKEHAKLADPQFDIASLKKDNT